MPSPDPIERVFADVGSEESHRQLFVLIYGELKDRAKRILANHNNPSLSATALVHEAYLKLASNKIATESKQHFYLLAARAMRQIMVDHARHRLYQKRDKRLQVSLDGELQQDSAILPELISTDLALEHLKQEDPDLVDLVHLHFFGGLSFSEIAEMQGVSLSTVERKWRTARTLLRAYMD